MGVRERLLFGGMRAATAAARAMLAVQTTGARRSAGPQPEGPLRVLLIAGRPSDNAGTRHRLANWAARLHALGLEARVDLAVAAPRGEELYRDWDARARAEYHLRALSSRMRSVRRSRYFDVAVLHLTDLPHWEYGHPFVARALTRTCGRVLLDLDDLPVVRGETMLGARAQELAASVDGLVLGNRELFDHFPGRPAWHIPTCVEPEAHEVAAARPASAPPVLGWIGTRGRLASLQRLAPVLARVCGRHGAIVRVVCDRPPDLPGVPLEFVPWAADDEAAQVAGFDIGLAPLDDGPVERCKCGLKALQYMAAGLALVAAPVGVLADMVEEGVTGHLAGTPEQWESALDGLLSAPARRRGMGAAGRVAATSSWSYAAHETRFLDALRGVRPDAPR